MQFLCRFWWHAKSLSNQWSIARSRGAVLWNLNKLGGKDFVANTVCWLLDCFRQNHILWVDTFADFVARTIPTQEKRGLSPWSCGQVSISSHYGSIWTLDWNVHRIFCTSSSELKVCVSLVAHRLASPTCPDIACMASVWVTGHLFDGCRFGTTNWIMVGTRCILRRY